MAIPDGWSEAAPGGMLINPDPATGGIIDHETLSGRWFVVFNDESRSTISNLHTRQEAIEAMDVALRPAPADHPDTGRQRHVVRTEPAARQQ